MVKPKDEQSSMPLNRKKFGLLSLGVVVLALWVYLNSSDCPPVKTGDVVGRHSKSEAADIKQPDDLYSVVFDAGSTGSRMFVFHFKLYPKDGYSDERLLLQSEVFEHIDPGISSYSQKPSEAAASLAPLLQKAVSSVPRRHQNTTLISLKATAGLRLLPREKGDQIIEEVRGLIKQSPFLLPDPSKIMVMGGGEEGLYGWITVNFLLDVLLDEVADNTVATIDLGGGSSQVTFELSDKADMSGVKIRELYKLRLLNDYFVVFTWSYLGCGLMSGRLGILGRGEGDLASPTKEPGSDKDTLTSSCFAEGFTTSWTHGENKYTIVGTSKSSSILEGCLADANNFVKKAEFMKNNQLDNKELHLFSYFFDVARWAGIVLEEETYKLMTPNDFLVGAKTYCEASNVRKSRPFLCMDLLYIYSMLTEGYGLRPERKIHVEKKIKGHEVSWSLGAALSTLGKHFTYDTLYL